MATQQTLQAVIDTNVLFEGITTQGSASGFIIEAWRAGLFTACVATALAYEYLEVCSGKLSPGAGSSSSPSWGRSSRRPASFRSIFRGARCRRTLGTSMSLTVL